MTAAAATPALGAPPPPPTAAEVFGPALPQACRYADLLCTIGVERGLIGPREPERIWSRHLLNSAALAEWVPAGARVADIGSGAGLPGIPLLLARPDLTMTLVEPMQRRATFLTQVCDELGLPAQVVRARGESLPPESFDVVVARAVAPLARLLDLVVPLLVRGGMLLALKGDAAPTEVEQARDVLRALPGAAVEVHEATGGGETTYVVQVRLIAGRDTRRDRAPAVRRQREDARDAATSNREGDA